MIYAYLCNNCGENADVIKPVSEYDKKELCKSCGCVMTREFAPRRVYLHNTAVQEKKFQPALGRAATDRELKQAAKENNWIEIGNERVEKHVKAPEIEYPTFSDDDIKALTVK